MNVRARKKPQLPDSDAALVGLLFALDPHAFGGVRIGGLPGPARTRWLKQVRVLRGESRRG